MATTPPPSSPARDWLSLGPASRLLGVDPDTLRRWADEGRILAYLTPGGHRRFDRGSLERVLTARRPRPRSPLSILGATPERLSAAYRRSYASTRSEPGRIALGVPDREAFRVDGRRLVQALVAHLDAVDPKERARADAQAVALTDELARRLAGMGTNLTEAVAQFVAARRPFLVGIGELAARRALDPGALSQLYQDASDLLDRLLLRLIATHGDLGQSRPGADLR